MRIKSRRKTKYVLRKLSVAITFCLLGSTLFSSIQVSAEENKSLTIPKVGDVLELDESKFYKIYDAYDENGKELDAVSENSRVIFNNGGAKVGWLKYGNKFEDTASSKYLWRASAFDESGETFVLTNQNAQNANSIIADTIGEDLNGSGAKNFVVVRKGNLSKGSPLKFIVMAVENGKTYVKIEQAPYTDKSGKKISDGRYMSTEDVSITKNTDVTKNDVRSYVTWVDSVSNTDRKAGWWVIEEVTTMPGSVEGSKLLFSTSAQKYHYRIPAITTTNKGDIVLFSDYRYDSNSDIGTNWTGWNGVDTSGYGKIGHRIDQVMRYSSDNGENWSAEKNLTEQYSYKGEANVKLANGYGDPALVADRESDKVLILSVGGSYGFHQDYPGVVSMLSNDGGRTFGEPKALAGRTAGTKAITEAPSDLGLYELENGGSELYSMFITSGRMMQSRYIKVGSSYRIYCAAPAKIKGTNEYKSFVFYSDDFGENWNMIPGIGINGADESKVEELPNGDVVITSRMAGGRKVNIFTYNKEDKTYSTGSWGTQSQFTIPGATAAVDGDLYILYAKNNETNEYGYLVCQTFCQGNGRNDVRVYYKWLDENSNTPEGFAKGFTAENSFTLAKNSSAYSVMTPLVNGKLGFAWEEGDMWYNIAYATLSLEEITNNKFSLAFDSGIGSVDSPYVINTEEKLNAYNDVYSNEGVYFKIEGTAKAIEEARKAIKVAEDAQIEAKKKFEEFNRDGVITSEEKNQIDALNKEIIAAKSLAENALEALGDNVDEKAYLVTRLEAVQEVDVVINNNDSGDKGEKETGTIQTDSTLKPNIVDSDRGGADNKNEVRITANNDNKDRLNKSNISVPQTSDAANVTGILGSLIVSSGFMVGLIVKRNKK